MSAPRFQRRLPCSAPAIPPRPAGTDLPVRIDRLVLRVRAALASIASPAACTIACTLACALAACVARLPETQLTHAPTGFNWQLPPGFPRAAGSRRQSDVGSQGRARPRTLLRPAPVVQWRDLLRELSQAVARIYRWPRARNRRRRRSAPAQLHGTCQRRVQQSLHLDRPGTTLARSADDAAASQRASRRNGIALA